MAFQQDVEAHHRTTYQNNIQMVAQQMRNPLRSAVTTIQASGEAVRVSDLLAKKKAQRAQDYAVANPDNRTKRDSRWLIRPEGIEDGEYIYKADMFDLALNPAGHLAANQVAAVERAVADVIMGVEEDASGNFTVSGSGIFGLATSGKARATTVFPGANIEAAAATGLTLDKIRAVIKNLRKAEFGMESTDPLFSAITAQQMDDLIGIAAASATPLNAFTIEQLQSGKPTSLMGITWIFTNRLPKDANGNRLIPVWSKKNVVAGFWQDLKGDMWNDTSKKNMPYIHTDAYLDCTRIEDAGVRAIACVEP